MNRLIRISYGPFQLLDLAPGEVEPVKRRVLMEQLGARTARALGLVDEDKQRRSAERSKRSAPKEEE